MAGPIDDGFFDRRPRPPPKGGPLDVSRFSSAPLSQPIPVVYGTAWVKGVPLYLDRAATHWVPEWHEPAGVPAIKGWVQGTAALAQVAFCQGPITSIDYIRRDKVVFQSGSGGVAQGRFDFKYLSAADDGSGAAFSYQPSFTLGDVATSAPWAALSSETSPLRLVQFGHLAMMRCERLALARGVPSMFARVRGKLATYVDPGILAESTAMGAAQTVYNALPGDVVKDILTSALWGVGRPAGSVVTDVGTDGNAASSFDRYCHARGWYIGLALTGLESAFDVVKMILAATDSTIAVSGSTWRVVPFGDSALTRGGYTYTPPSISIGLTDDDLVLDSPDRDPVELDQVGEEDTRNAFPVTYVPGYGWSEDTAPAESMDVASVATTKLRRAAPRDLPCIRSGPYAQQISALMASRSVYNRTTARFSVNWRHPEIEPGDFVSLTHEKLGFTAKAFRVLSTEEGPDGATAIEAVEWMTGVSLVPVYNPQTADGLPQSPLSGGDPAVGAVIGMGSDAVFSASEHAAALTAWNDLNGSKADLVSKASDAGVSSAAWVAAWQALGTYLNGGSAYSSGTPAWLVAPFSDVAVVPATWQSTWAAAYNERAQLQNAIATAILSGAVTVGGGNLVKNSGFLTDTDGTGYPDYWANVGTFTAYTTDAVDTPLPWVKALKVTTSNTYTTPRITLLNPAKIWLPAGTKVVLTAYVKAEAGRNVYLYCKFFPTQTAAENGASAYTPFPVGTGAWTRYVHRFTVVAGGEWVAPLIGISQSIASSVEQFSVAGVQLEVGDVPTAYSACPSDAYDPAIAALQAAADAQATADGEIAIFWQTTAPASASYGDIWFDTDAGNAIYTWRDTGWVSTPTSGVGRAILAASTAQGTADGKSVVYYQAANPGTKTANDIGDIWVDTDDHNKVYVYANAGGVNGWVLAQDWYTANATANAAKTAIDNMALDSKLTPQEKLAAKIAYDALAAQGASAKAKALAVPAPTGPLPTSSWDTPKGALDTYLATISPAWNDPTTAESTIVGATWMAKWKDAYEGVTKLLGEIAAAAQGRADSAMGAATAAADLAQQGIDDAAAAAALVPIRVATLPTLPSSTYPAGTLVYDLTTKRLYRSTGSTWEDTTVAAAGVIGQLAASQLADGAITAAKIGFALGGFNLLPNSSFEVDSNADGYADSWAAYVGVASPSLDSANSMFGGKAQTFLTDVGGSSCRIALIEAMPYIPAGTTVVLSAYMKAATGQQLYLLAKIRSTPTGGSELASLAPTGSITTATGSWQRVTVVFRSISTAGYFQPQWGLVTGTAGIQVWCDCIQAEVGDVATAWTPKADELLPGSVGQTTIQDGAISTPKIVAGAIVAEKIGASAVVAGKIAANAVTATEIAAGAITTAKLAADSVTANEIAAGAVGADQIAANSVVAKHLTVANFDNLWPNPTSETAPPSGADATAAEWLGRTEWAGSHAGGYCRQITTGASGYAYITHSVPAMPGESYYFEAQLYGYSGPGNAFVEINFRDAAGGFLGSALSSTYDTNPWAKRSVGAVAPAGTARVEFHLAAAANGGVSVMRFDSIFARRMNDGNLVVDGSVTAAKIAADSIATADYSYSGTLGQSSEVATQGARMRVNASPGASLPAIITSPAGIKIGSKTLDQSWLNQGRVVSFVLRSISGSITGLGPVGYGAGMVSVSSGGVVSIPTGIANTPRTVVAIGKKSDGSMLFNSSDSVYATDSSGYATFYLCGWDGAVVTDLSSTSWWLNIQIIVGSSSF